MILGLRHTGIVVKDLDACLHFYRDLLGFVEVKRMEEGSEYIDTILALVHANVTTVKLAAPDGGQIELLQFHSHQPQNDRDIFTYGLSHIALTVSDLDFQWRVLRSEGVSFMSLPTFSPDRGAKVCFCMDPEGNTVELVEALH